MTIKRRTWVPDEQWIALSAKTTSRCRMIEGKARTRCPNTAVAQFRRGHRSISWWAYCADHLYGRRLNNGVVEILRWPLP